MTIIVTGSKGMLGRDLSTRLKASGLYVKGFDIDDLDITLPDDILPYFKPFKPDIVVNCAAYTAVDKAESEPEMAFAVNKDGPSNLARACRELGIPLVHISTDYVFDGKANRPYREDDPVNPIGIYGQSKCEGEKAVRSQIREHLIIRTSWLYGVHGHNFVKTIFRLCREKKELRVVSDQRGCPTWTGDLSDALVSLVDRVRQNKNDIPWGTYHFCGKGKTTWHGFTEKIVELAKPHTSLKIENVEPITTAEYPTPAQRPANSVLDCSLIANTFNITPLPWENSLSRAISALFEA